jgi:type IV secretion system protein VirB10
MRRDLPIRWTTHLIGFGIIAVVSCCGAAAQDAAGPLPPKPAAVAPQGQPLQQAQPPAVSAPTQAATTATPSQAAHPAAATQQASAAKIEVPTGTKLPLILHNAITTRNAHPGDPLYLETLFPIVLNNKILIPAGSYVQGEILDAKRPGKVKGRGEMQIRLNTMILPNGYTVNFNAVPTNAGTGGDESVDKEGKIQGDTDKTTDAGTIVKGTAIGAGIGGIATRTGTGAGIGAGAGAAAGLLAVLLTRGPELELPRGTTFDVVLDRTLHLDATYITFTDPGHASTMPGPPNREPTRSRSPF